MKTRKEQYRDKLPHFQQPGQWYFVTFHLAGTIPKGLLNEYVMRISTAKNRYQLLLRNCKTESMNKNKYSDGDFRPDYERENDNILLAAKKEYYTAIIKYRLMYDKFLHETNGININLTKESCRSLIAEALQYWEGARIKNHAWCIMSNHVHWVLSVKETSEKDEPVYLQDILHSVKLYTAQRINKIEKKTGLFWDHESFETTLRNPDHFYNAVNYTIQNPVSAGLVKNWEDWEGIWISEVWKPEF